MNGIHSGMSHNLENAFPGCLGSMVNLFDLSAGMAGNGRLTDKPHRDGSPLSRRSQSDVTRMGQFEDQIEDKVMSELSRTCSNRNSSGTPMKTLIAQEMSKEVDSKHNPPSVVAKLMGLDAFPQQQPDLAKQRRHSRVYSRSLSETPLSYWQHDKGFWDLQVQDKFHHCPQHDECKDVYEIMQQSPKPNCARDKSPHKGRCDETPNDRKMALVRQKFIEAKRMSTDEKLRQTRQFQDALEVLNSNKDLFLKFLQEPNSMFSQHLCNLQSVPHPPETKRITVLRPCKMVDDGKFVGSAKKNEKQLKKAAHVGQAIGSDKSYPGLSPTAGSWKLDENPIQPTRIVVLKPSPGKHQDIKAVVSPPPLSPRTLDGEEFIEETEDDEARKSREVAKEITRQMRENLCRPQMDETFLSSVFSNGYIGDESSFHKSENEYAAGNLSDSEVMSPTSRHSWDYVNRFGSPYSSSSFSRASYSPESSVCREAKKRLSERWALMASHGNYQEQRRVHRSSSTLGEMLALSDTKNKRRNVEGGAKEDPKVSTEKLVADQNKDEEIDNSPRNFVRSKSVPVSSTVFGIQLNADVPDQKHKKTEVSEEAAKARSGKLSLKGKVSNLFFSRSKKSIKEKSIASQSKDELQCAGTPSDAPGRTNNDRTRCQNEIALEKCPSPSLHQFSGKVSSADPSGKPGFISSEAGLSVAKHLESGNPSVNQDQPSPISVLEIPFEEDEHTATESSSNNKLEEHGDLPLQCKSNLIDKSPPIGSIARTLSLDDSCVDTATSYPLKPSFYPQGAEEEEREWFFFVQALLSVAGLDGEVQSDTFLPRWHSSESPLDPSLRDKYINLNEKDTLHEAKRRQRRSTRKLVFDCVNAALVDIAGYGSDTCQRAIPCGGPDKTLLEGASLIMVDQVWARMKDWFSGEERCVAGDCGDNNSLLVERVVRKEVVGKVWLDHLRLEMDNLGKEIERKLLEELVQEAVVELTGRVCRGFFHV
ncbi:hypothetical protein ACH5RR_010479 [Cinchona calisaya]|uniref:DUF4378 domain-containing protein n=1 Tax=Cinchona calisaya TaxID=153742 RepID=A0ABD3AJ20_9GENT